MIPNIKRLRKLVDEKFNGNKSSFAHAIGVERSQISRILNNGIGAGSLFFGGLMEFCEKEGLEFKEYIFLPNNVNKVNDKSAINL